MGCCQSSFLSETHPETHHQNSSSSATPPLQHQQPRPSAAGAAASVAPAAGVPAFAEFSFADLKAATNNFSSEFIVSESGEKAPNLVYKGRLKNHQWIAVKKFTKLAWPDPKQFAVYLPLYSITCSGIIFFNKIFWLDFLPKFLFLDGFCLLLCLHSQKLIWVFGDFVVEVLETSAS